MSKLIRSKDDLINYIKKADGIARSVVGDIATNELAVMFERRYYDAYTPIRYKRLNQLGGMAKYSYGDTTYGKGYSNGLLYINIDPTGAIYKINDVEYIVDLALRGYHGTEDIPSNPHISVWEIFLDYYYNVMPEVYKRELDEALRML